MSVVGEVSTCARRTLPAMKNDQAFNVETLIALAETKDEVGSVLRAHLLVERFLVSFIDVARVGDRAHLIKQPRDFATKVGLATALGLPLPFASAAYELNVIRNSLAHRMEPIDPSQVAQFAREVDKAVNVVPNFVPLKIRSLELAQKRPGERIRFGAGVRTDFVIAAIALLAAVIEWLATRAAPMVEGAPKDS